MTDVRVPTLGESVTEATVATWFKQPGDNINMDEMLCELETDKVTVEVPSPAAGVMGDIVAQEGSVVSMDALLTTISEGRAEKPENEKKLATQKDNNVIKANTEVISGSQNSDIEDAPSAKKLMAENNISPNQITGTGKEGRIMKDDVLKVVQSAVIKTTENSPVSRAPSAVEDADREERVKMTRLRQTIAKRLKDSQNTAAMLTTYNEVDMTEVMSLRNEFKELFEKKHGTKLGFMSFFTKACCHALKEVPEVNAEIDGTDIVYKNYVHMGIAAGTPTGLVVPVIRNADSMSFAEIEKSISEKGKRARDGKLSMDEMQGGTFTISNGGVYGSLMSSPILNPPQSGILGMHNIQKRAVVVDDEIVIRPMMYLAFSYDHRIIDGKESVGFLVNIKSLLENPSKLILGV